MQDAQQYALSGSFALVELGIVSKIVLICDEK